MTYTCTGEQHVTSQHGGGTAEQHGGGTAEQHGGGVTVESVE